MGHGRRNCADERDGDVSSCACVLGGWETSGVVQRMQRGADATHGRRRTEGRAPQQGKTLGESDDEERAGG